MYNIITAVLIIILKDVVNKVVWASYINLQCIFLEANRLPVVEW